ncbi:hypothetical protein EDB83DRAFT_2550138 [Lactarius deliciosus]|nr:hypothetical protein EDB83DRAFT_2550138 [Lactarius deliciosus]
MARLANLTLAVDLLLPEYSPNLRSRNDSHRLQSPWALLMWACIVSCLVEHIFTSDKMESVFIALLPMTSAMIAALIGWDTGTRKAWEIIDGSKTTPRALNQPGNVCSTPDREGVGVFLTLFMYNYVMDTRLRRTIHESHYTNTIKANYHPSQQEDGPLRLPEPPKTGRQRQLLGPLRDYMGAIAKRSVPTLSSYLTIEKLGVNTERQWKEKKYMHFNICVHHIICIVGNI